MKKSIFLLLVPLAAVTILTASCSQSSADWTHFRGSSLDGIAAPGEYPTTWNDSTNIRWIAPAEGRGWSSPVVHSGQVWLTSASPDGKEMFALCYDLKSGEQIFRTELFMPDSIYKIHAVNSYACINTVTGEKCGSG